MRALCALSLAKSRYHAAGRVGSPLLHARHELYRVGGAVTQFSPLVGNSAGLTFPSMETLIQGIEVKLDHDPSHLFKIPTLSEDIKSGTAKLTCKRLGCLFI